MIKIRRAILKAQKSVAKINNPAPTASDIRAALAVYGD